MGARLDRVYRRVHSGDSGAVAAYIPELAKADPNQFGIAIAAADGHVYSVGDADREFTIQSISKPFVFGIALDDRGPVEVMHRIGVEPSGDAFNSIVMDERNNRPLNPMVNAGPSPAAHWSAAPTSRRGATTCSGFSRPSPGGNCASTRRCAPRNAPPGTEIGPSPSSS